MGSFWTWIGDTKAFVEYTHTPEERGSRGPWGEPETPDYPESVEITAVEDESGEEIKGLGAPVLSALEREALEHHKTDGL